MYVGMVIVPFHGSLLARPVVPDTLPVVRCSRKVMLSSCRLLVPAALACLTLPGVAAAATLEPLKRCYVSVDAVTREPLTVRGAGFNPSATVDLAVDGIVVATVRSGPDGTLPPSTATAPYQARDERPFSVRATERDAPASTATASSRVTALSLRVKPRRARPSRRVRFSGRGFTGSGRVWGHYSYAGKVRRTVRFGRPHGACGRFDVRRRQIPVRRPRTGTWTLQIDQQKAFSRAPDSVFVRLAITVARVFRSVQATPAGSSAAGSG